MRSQKWIPRSAAVILTLFIFLVIGFVLLMRLPPPQPPKATLTFIGFTNTGVRTEALFWFTNTTAPEFGFDVRQIRRLTLDGWILQPALTNGPSVYSPISKTITDWDLIGIPVATNNAPFEITI